MSDTPPPSNSSRSTPTPLALPGLRQLSEVSEPELEPARESRMTVTLPVDAPTSSGEPDENKNEDKIISPCKRFRYLQVFRTKPYLFFYNKKNSHLGARFSRISIDKFR